jgi:hypothetical protein
VDSARWWIKVGSSDARNKIAVRNRGVKLSSPFGGREGRRSHLKARPSTSEWKFFCFFFYEKKKP